jgi:hypothetical protein
VRRGAFDVVSAELGDDAIFDEALELKAFFVGLASSLPWGSPSELQAERKHGAAASHIPVPLVFVDSSLVGRASWKVRRPDHEADAADRRADATIEENSADRVAEVAAEPQYGDNREHAAC